MNEQDEEDDEINHEESQLLLRRASVGLTKATPPTGPVAESKVRLVLFILNDDRVLS